jgi:hypothetical protein
MADIAPDYTPAENPIDNSGNPVDNYQKLRSSLAGVTTGWMHQNSSLTEEEDSDEHCPTGCVLLVLSLVLAGWNEYRYHYDVEVGTLVLIN